MYCTELGLVGALRPHYDFHVSSDATETDRVAVCARTFADRIARQERQGRVRAERLRDRARAAARWLVERHGVRRVWLFGSLAWGEAHPGSDVDLLVEGLRLEGWSEACADVEEKVGTAVDLVRVEEATPGLPERVIREGWVLHDAG